MLGSSESGAPPAQANANLGGSVALSATHALIGASGYNYPLPGGGIATDSGNAYLYTIADGTWTGINGFLSTTGTNAPTPQGSSQFGVSVALSATHALVGASLATRVVGLSNSGNAYLYRIEGGIWTELLADTPLPDPPDIVGLPPGPLSLAPQ